MTSHGIRLANDEFGEIKEGIKPGESVVRDPDKLIELMTKEERREKFGAGVGFGRFQ